MAMPNGRATIVATVATLRLRRTAVHSSVLRPNQSMLRRSPRDFCWRRSMARGDPACQERPALSTVKPCAWNTGLAFAEVR